MNTATRSLQLIGLLLIGVLSMAAGTATASNTRPAEEEECWDFNGCRWCHYELAKCTTWICPVGHPHGIGIVCERS